MKYKSLFPWLLLDMALFISLNVLILRYLNVDFEVLGSVRPLQLLILALAVYRGANIISNEFVTKPVRAYFVREVERDGKEVEEPYEYGLRGFLGSLLYCPSCTGVWISAILIYSYLLWPGPVSIVILILALSGLERFFAYTFGRIKNYK